MGTHRHSHTVTAAGLLITLGIIFGDIGTSPLYVMKAIVGDRVISEQLILGGVSCVFWTLTLQTTLKYVVFTLRADNNGEGGIFSLYALVRKLGKWLVYPAMIGGCTLLADGIITPAISITSAIEGLIVWNPSIPHSVVIPLVVGILTLLFFVQQFGTHIIGRAFGPIMMLWFSMLAVLGLGWVTTNPRVLWALNPYYAYDLLAHHPEGFLLLGAVFLCTTGAEALYSDMGHCGRENIRVSWVAVKLALILNYMGQGAWLLQFSGSPLHNRNPFFGLMPDWFVIIGVVVATLATIIASQALISGSFTLISEAIQLGFWPKTRIQYPSDEKGQLYVPGTNWALYLGCVGIVLFFGGESSRMEAAYGLAITLTMLSTTLLLLQYLRLKRYSGIFISLFATVYLAVEGAFLVSNLNKIAEDGWISLVVAGVLLFIMFIWRQARIIKDQYHRSISLQEYLPQFIELSNDQEVPKYASHLVYLTGEKSTQEIDEKIIYSIFRKQPKRADIYWFVHVNVEDEPYRMEYAVKILAPDDVIRIDFHIGFRVQPRINLLYRKVIEDLVASGEVNITSRYHSLNKYNYAGDFRFVVLERFLSNDVLLPLYERYVMSTYYLLKFLSLSDEKSYGLDTSNVTVEKVPLVVGHTRNLSLKRILPSDTAPQS
jgi:KUP system potassium uptake protein